MVYDPREIAGIDDLRVYGGFQYKHREFIDSLLHVTGCSPHRRSAMR